MKETERHACDCGLPSKCAEDPNVPVGFDAELKEYFIQSHDGGVWVMYYCFFCGGRMSESKRGDEFLAPSESELQEIHSLVRNIKTAKDMVEVLGEPDEVVGYSENQHNEFEMKLYDVEAWKKRYFYRERWETFNLIVHESIDGKLVYFMPGKYTGKA